MTAADIARETAGRRLGDTVLFRRVPRFERNYSKFMHLGFMTEDCVPFTVGVTDPEAFLRELYRRVYRPLISTSFNPARLP